MCYCRRRWCAEIDDGPFSSYSSQFSLRCPFVAHYTVDSLSYSTLARLLTMDNRLAPANVDAGDLPSGFSTTDPNGSSAAAAGQDNQGQQRQAQKDGILEQALTPDALERLRRIKVREVQCAVCCFLKYAY
jgi:hypothetical protein